MIYIKLSLKKNSIYTNVLISVHFLYTKMLLKNYNKWYSYHLKLNMIMFENFKNLLK